MKVFYYVPNAMDNPQEQTFNTFEEGENGLILYDEDGYQKGYVMYEHLTEVISESE